MKLYPQLNFGGNCKEAFQFYEKHLGGKIMAMMTQKEMPGAPADAGDAIVHAQMVLGNTLLIGNDVPAERFQRMRSVYLYLEIDSSEEAERIYDLLREGGEIYMEMQRTFFASEFAMLRDRFGVSWTLLHERPRR